MQEYWLGVGSKAQLVQLPPAEEELLPGVLWGRGETPDTPAYWALRCKIEDNPLHGFCREAGGLLDEIAFCMLGGFGITVELNDAAFEHLTKAKVFNLNFEFSEEQIRQLLCDPLSVRGKLRRYRFPNQRANRICRMLNKVRSLDLDRMGIQSVKTLLHEIEGIGPKTAAWILRNHFGSDDVAILDIHVIRACVKLGVFPKDVRLPRDYDMLEEKFLQLAVKLSIRPSILDAVMWEDMRNSRLK